MNLDDIPAGSFCVLDTNVLIYAEQGVSVQAQRLLRRIQSGDVTGVLPQPVWQETMHRLMVTEAVMRGYARGANPARQLAAKPELVKRLTIYREKVRALATLGLGFEPCHEDDLMDKALEIQERFGLLTNDSLIAAITLRVGADALASADGRFQAIKEIKLYSPSDLDLASSS
ncbi:MAG TPA: type II toxin-antitoxin system VapC family toxin [Candidatus Acidoferrales bacterium]|nr:type II toxin-antitoxin system VapC family toxin [Candidatus Acidoferrales bacterium]